MTNASNIHTRSVSESQTYQFTILLCTQDGELPTDAEVETLVADQLSGELDPETGLFAGAVTLRP
jgi:hypothetical protein